MKFCLSGKGYNQNMAKFVRLFSLYRFLDAVKPVGVIFVLLFAHHGLTPFQISLLIGLWSATQLVFEVPLGAVADKFSRRNLLILAQTIHFLGFLLWLKGDFLFYAFGFFLWGIKNALASGTLEAFVYDELKSLGKESLYEKVNGQMESAFWSGITLSALLGGFFASFNYDLVLIVSLLTTLLAALALLMISPVSSFRSTGETKYFSILKKAFSQIKDDSFLGLTIAFLCLAFATYGAADEYWSLVYQALGLPVFWIGGLVSLGYGFFILAGWSLRFFTSPKIRGRDYLFLVIGGLFFLAAGLLNSLFSLLLIFSGMFFLKIAHLKFEAKFQAALPSGQRATLSSFKSLIFELVYMPLVLFFGLVADKINPIFLVFLLGAMLLFWLAVFGLFFPAVFRKLLLAQSLSAEKSKS